MGLVIRDTEGYICDLESERQLRANNASVGSTLLPGRAVIAIVASVRREDSAAFSECGGKLC